MVTPWWPGLSLARGELELVPRREAFRRAHPGTEFDHIGDVYVGHVPYTDRGAERSITIKGDSWVVVLDALDEYFAADPDG